MAKERTRYKVKRTKGRSLKRRSFKNTKIRRTKRIKRTKRTKRTKRMKGGGDAATHPPEGMCYKIEFKSNLWFQKYVKIEGNALNVYALQGGVPTGEIRKSSIPDLKGVVVTVGTETFPRLLATLDKLIITNGVNMKGSNEKVELAFSNESTGGLQGSQIMNQFKEAIENISQGREWNVNEAEEEATRQAEEATRQKKAEAEAASGIQLFVRDRQQIKQARGLLEENRKQRLEETDAMEKKNRRNYLRGSDFKLLPVSGSVKPSGDYHGSLTPCSVDYSVKQCGPTCWFTSLTTFIVKNKNIRLLFGRTGRLSNREFHSWLGKLHGEQINKLITLRDETVCTLQTQGMCLLLPDSLKVLMNLYEIVKTRSDFRRGSAIHTQVNRALMGYAISSVDAGYFTEGGCLPSTLATMLSGLLFREYEDIYCVNINLLSLSHDNYGEPLAVKIRESMVDTPISMLVLANITENNCPITLFDYLKKIHETLEKLEGDITIVGGGLSVISFEEMSADERSFQQVEGFSKDVIRGSGHAISFKTCVESSKIKINISDTGIGIDYFIWWEDGVMKTSNIEERWLTLHGWFHMALNSTCWDKFTKHDVSGGEAEKICDDRGGGDLTWLPLSCYKPDQEKIEDKMGEMIHTHCLGAAGLQTLILINHSKLELHKVFSDTVLPCAIQPFLHSCMDLKTKTLEEKAKIISDREAINDFIKMEQLVGEGVRQEDGFGTEEPTQDPQTETVIEKKSREDLRSWETLQAHARDYGTKA